MKKLLVLAMLAMSAVSFGQDSASAISASTIVLTDAVSETILSPFASTSATTVAAARVEMEAVKEDANDFLAGADKTEMLDAVMKRVRENAKEDISEVSDEKIALTILNVLN